MGHPSLNSTAKGFHGLTKKFFFGICAGLLVSPPLIAEGITSNRYFSEQHGLYAQKRYDVTSLIFNDQDDKLYVFGHNQTELLETDGTPITEEPRILQYSNRGHFEQEISAAVFGLREYAPHDHRYDTQTKQTWFVDPVQRRILKFSGNPKSAAADFFKMIKPGPDNSDEFSGMRMPDEVYWEHLNKIPPGPNLKQLTHLESIPRYGFSVSITKNLEAMWIKQSDGGNDPVWARDEKNSLIWDSTRGLLRIYSEKTKKTVKVDPGDYVMNIFPNSEDATAWVYLSHNKGDLVNYNKRGEIVGKIPILKYRGKKVPILIDFRRRFVWYLDNGYPCKVIKKSLSGEKLLELMPPDIIGEDTGACSSQITLQLSDGGIWLYFPRHGLVKIDSSGKRLGNYKLNLSFPNFE